MDHHQHYQLTELPHPEPHTCCVEAPEEVRQIPGEGSLATLSIDLPPFSPLLWVTAFSLVGGGDAGGGVCDLEGFFSHRCSCFCLREGRALSEHSQTPWCSSACVLPLKALPSSTWSHTSHRCALSASSCGLGVQNISNNKTSHVWKQWQRTPSRMGQLLAAEVIPALSSTLCLTSLLMENYWQRRFHKANYSTNHHNKDFEQCQWATNKNPDMGSFPNTCTYTYTLNTSQC